MSTISLAEAFMPDTGRPAGEMHKSGLTLAKVTNINDPESLGRIKCRPVSQNPDVAETDWCFCMTPSGGGGYGIFFFPNVDDLVILAYLYGEVHHPFVLGRYWAGSTAAPYKIESGVNEISSIRTPTGIEIKFDDKKDRQTLLAKTPSGSNMLIDDGTKTITVRDKDAKNALTIKWGDGEIELKADKKLTLVSGNSKITLQSDGEISIESNSSVSVKSRDVTVKADASFDAESAASSVKANTMLTLTSSGQTVVKGAIVNIN